MSDQLGGGFGAGKEGNKGMNLPSKRLQDSAYMQAWIPR